MGTVTIASKLHVGLILELITPSKGRMPTPIDEEHKRVEIKGTNSLLLVAGSPSQGIHRYATTEVDEEFWNEWLKRNKGLACIRNGQVFVAKNENEAKAMARERVGSVRTGFEALAQKNDPRLKSVPGAQAVETDEDHLRKLGSAATSSGAEAVVQQ